MAKLTSVQKKYLRGLAHPYKPLVQVGEKGVTEAVVLAIDQALQDHELIKVRMREPEDKTAMAEDMATRCSASLCGLVGHTVILYRRHPDNPKIHLR